MTSVLGGGMGGTGPAVSDGGLGRWESQDIGVDYQKTQGQIVKTLHINQYVSSIKL